MPRHHEVPEHTDETQEGYYSVFQIYHLSLVLLELSFEVHLDGLLDPDEGATVDWQLDRETWLEAAKQTSASLCAHEYRPAVALLCQHISNRYFPRTQGDMRTITVPRGGLCSDHWILVNTGDWDWWEQARQWNPKQIEKL